MAVTVRPLGHKAAVATFMVAALGAMVLAPMSHGIAGVPSEPLVAAPAQSFPPTGTTVPQKSSNLVHEVTTWRLRDAGANGFSHYVLEQYNTYANSWGVVYYGTDTRYEALLPAVQFTEFRLTPYDSGGQPGPTQYGQGFTPVVADDSATTAAYATSIHYSRGWSRRSADTAYGGSYRRSTKAGASVKYCGYFTRVAIVAPRTARGGKASVRVFGATHTISFRSSASRYREVVRQWRTAAQAGVPAGSGPTYCMKVTAKSSAPIFVDAIDYDVPDIIE